MPNLRITKDVHVGESLSTRHEDLNNLRGETALRLLWTSFHVKQYTVIVNLFFDRVLDAHVFTLQRRFKNEIIV